VTVRTGSLLARYAGTAAAFRRPHTLAQWFTCHGESVCGTVSISRITAGRTNIISAVADRSGPHWILHERRPGFGHDFSRQARVIAAVRKRGLPVPRLVGRGESPGGTTFMVTARIPGFTLHTQDDAHCLPIPERRDITARAVTTLAAIHRLTPADVDLRGNAIRHIDSQLMELTDVWTRAGTSSSHDSAWRAIRSRLADRQPRRSHRMALVHGDFRLANLVYDGTTLRAVLDWDSCTIGDPVSDLAWLLTDWRGPNEPDGVPSSPTRAGGFPTRDEVIDIYQQASGSYLEDLTFHRALAQWRAATLLQQELARQHAHGFDDDTAALNDAVIEDEIATLLLGAATFLRESR
jgi:aminoglycoside phosphotransferase (APT) family kinase protein